MNRHPSTVDRLARSRGWPVPLALTSPAIGTAS